MKKLTSLILIIFTLSNFAIGQTRIKGTIINDNSESLQFANIGFIGTTVGTVSNVNGDFQLIFDESEITISDTLKVSMIGYKAIKIPLHDLKESIHMNLRMQRNIIEIEEVIISSTPLKSKTMGGKKRSLIKMNVNFALSQYENQNLGSEIGKKFKIKYKNTSINSLSFYLLENNYDTTLFRINIYSLKKKLPYKNLLDQNIITSVLNKHEGWITVDLRQFNILINDDVIVTVEWVGKSDNGNKLALPISWPTAHVHFYKYGSQNHWKRFNGMSTLMRLGIEY